MSIGTYLELVAAVEDYMDLDSLPVGTCIQLAESRLNRVLDDPKMEVSVTLTGDGADLPDDFGAMVSIGTSDGNPLREMGAVDYSSVYPLSGTPRFYTIREGKIYYTPGSTNPTLVYRQRIPALTENAPTNWLLALAPDAYFHSTLAEAYIWDHDEERAQFHKAAADEIISELRVDGERRKWGAGPIAPRINRP